MRPAWLVLLATLAFAQEPEDPVVFTVAGRVLDRHAEPLAGLRVEAWDRMAPERYLAQTASGPKGRFLLAVRASAAARREHAYAPVILVARGAGMAEARLEAQAGARDVEVRTAKATVIRGVVRDPAGHAVPAAVVHASRDGPFPIVEETTTDEEGRFGLHRFAVQEVQVEVDADGNRTARRALAGRDNEIRLPPVARAGGRLLDADTGAPIAGARVLRSGRPAGETDSDGRFSFPEPVSAGDRVVVPVAFWKEGYDASPVDVALRQPGDYRLRRVAPLRGRVVDESDRPVSGARVVVEEAGIVTWSDAEGSFALGFLPLGISRLRASRSGFVDAAVRMELGLAPDTVTLRLSRGARVSGRVSGGGPALGVRVAVHDERNEIACAFTDKEGRFLLRGVPATGRFIVASEPRRRSMCQALEGLEEGALVGPLTLEMREHLPWSGTVRSDAGPPLKGAVVRCGDRCTTTDEAGRFLFESVPVRRQRLQVEAPKHKTIEVQGFPGRALDLVAESRFGDRRVTVAVDGERSGEAEIVLQRRWPPRVRRAGVSDLPGRLVFSGLMPGDYDLTVTAPGHLDDTRVVVVAGEDVETSVKLERGGSVRLETSPGAAVAIQAVRGRPPPVVALRLADGARELRGFGPGRYRFISRAPGEFIVVKEAELGPTTPPVRLDLRGGKESTLAVTVLDLAGDPVQGAEILLVTEGGFAHNTRRQTGPDGRVLLTRLIGGRLHVLAQRGNRAGRAALDVTPGTGLSVTITIR